MSALGDVDPVDVALDMLKAELPGFEAQMIAARDAIGIRGGLPIRAELSAETVLWPISRSPIFELALDDVAPAVVRDALKLELEPVIDRIVERIRRLAIDAVGLEKVIVERERRARIDGERVGHALGFAAGKREGRAEATRELANAFAMYVDNELVEKITGIELDDDGELEP